MDIKKMREFLKDTVRKQFDFSQTGQSRGMPAPPFEKPCAAQQKIVELPRLKDLKAIGDISLAAAIKKRRSRRVFLEKELRLEELSFLLWAAQGVVRKGEGYTLRTVPSAGARHALETYIYVLRVQTLAAGVYRYLPLRHALALEFLAEAPAEKFSAAALGQDFVAGAAAVFVWAAVPYRMEWRYGPAAHKAIALDAGHVCQNLYLACEAVSCGMCAVAAYDQEKMDRLLRLDGDDEFVIYLAPVGKV